MEGSQMDMLSKCESIHLSQVRCLHHQCRCLHHQCRCSHQCRHLQHQCRFSHQCGVYNTSRGVNNTSAGTYICFLTVQVYTQLTAEECWCFHGNGGAYHMPTSGSEGRPCLTPCVPSLLTNSYIQVCKEHILIS